MADLLSRSDNVLAPLLVSETSLDELLAVLDEEVVDGLITDRSDLDELRETISDLSNW